LERSWKGSYGIHRPEYQELGETATGTPLMTLRSIETQNVDLA
jgi:hypothetical protein